LGLALVGVLARIARVNGEVGEKCEPAPERAERRVVVKKEAEQVVQVVCPRHR
jgi:hypothetical protein